MPAKQQAKAKGKTQALAVKKRQGAAKLAPEMPSLICKQACAFRNLMKYRASDDCKKA